MGNINLFVSTEGHGKGGGYGYGIGNGGGNGYGIGNGYGSRCDGGGGHGYGDGYGIGDDSGNGNGVGDGNGNGHGIGHGCGHGYGYGCNGNGNGNGGGDGADDISKFNDETVHIINNVPTIITRLKDNIAKGFILNQDFTLTKCYVVKRDNLFAHGENLRDALKSLQDKIFRNMNIEERIEMFMEEFNLTDRYPSMKFFEWHNKLTGSCEMGRKAFAKNHGIDLETDTFTVSEFIELTENDYGSKAIKQLKERIKQ